MRFVDFDGSGRARVSWRVEGEEGYRRWRNVCVCVVSEKDCLMLMVKGDY